MQSFQYFLIIFVKIRLEKILKYHQLKRRVSPHFIILQQPRISAKYKPICSAATHICKVQTNEQDLFKDKLPFDEAFLYFHLMGKGSKSYSPSMLLLVLKQNNRRFNFLIVAVVQRCSVKNVFLEISQIHRKTLVSESLS